MSSTQPQVECFRDVIISAGYPHNFFSLISLVVSSFFDTLSFCSVMLYRVIWCYINVKDKRLQMTISRERWCYSWIMVSGTMNFFHCEESSLTFDFIWVAWRNFSENDEQLRIIRQSIYWPWLFVGPIVRLEVWVPIGVTRMYNHKPENWRWRWTMMASGTRNAEQSPQTKVGDSWKN